MRTSNFLAATLAVGLLVLATANAKDTDVAKDAVEAWFAKQVNPLLPLLDRLSLVSPLSKSVVPHHHQGHRHYPHKHARHSQGSQVSIDFGAVRLL
jgi:hypothetical protein